MRIQSNKINVQLIAEIFLAFGIKDIVLSPGSRNGALTMQFVNDKKFNTYSIVDERSAAFVALGMAQQSKQPVVICCTSGSAITNYYPAVTEAFYQNVPLIVLSADRPEYLTDNFDGQTIRQNGVLEKHTYHNVQLSEDESTESLTENMLKLKHALTKCIHHSGPIHINIPFSEPLYETTEQSLINIERITLAEKKVEIPNFTKLSKSWNTAKKKLVLVGMHSYDKDLNLLLSNLAYDDSVVVLTEVTSNLHDDRFFNKIDQLLFPLPDSFLEDLRPDILLTVGQNVVSKKVKAFIRAYKPTEHWHLDEYWQPDTFQCLTDKIELNAVVFLEGFVPLISKKEGNHYNYYNKWNIIRKQSEIKHNAYLTQLDYSDLKVFSYLIKNYPKDWQIHYANSTPIRYAQLFDHDKSNEIFCNRGTSGIDGSTSTAVGACMQSKKNTLIVTGDISFFYDSNALWNAKMPHNLRIILLNNGGGNIFKFIPGPSQTGVVDEYFETKHSLTAEHLAKMFQFDYISVSSMEELYIETDNFYILSDKPKILEINTRNVANEVYLKEYFLSIKPNN